MNSDNIRFENRAAEEKRQFILNCIDDALSDLMYYDRKQCEVSKPGDFEQAIRDGVITIGEMVEMFRKTLARSVGE